MSSTMDGYLSAHSVSTLASMNTVVLEQGKLVLAISSGIPYRCYPIMVHIVIIRAGFSI